MKIGPHESTPPSHHLSDSTRVRTLQMTPSQSKMKTSVLSRSCEAGSDSLETFALIAVVVASARDVCRETGGAKAETEDVKRDVNANWVNFMIYRDGRISERNNVCTRYFILRCGV